MNLEKEIRIKYHQGVVRALESEREGIHVSHLKFPCVRRGYYDMITNSPSYKFEDAYRMLLGKQMHEFPCDQHHHLQLEFDEITGEIDEYNQDKAYLWDKKYTGNPPHWNKKRPREHDQTQVQYYSVLLDENEYPIEQAAVMYIDTEKKRIHIKEAEIPKDLSDVKTEMLKKKVLLEKALEEGKPPERNPNEWLCAYCSHYPICYQ